MKNIKITAKEIVQFLYSGGDLVGEFQSNKRALEGTEAHQYLQNKYQKDDQKEVSVETLFDYENYSFHITGRMDGLLLENNKLIVEEIKSTKVDLKMLEIDTRPEHLMQAKMYAYMYLIKHKKKSINVRLTYIYVEGYETKSFNKRYNKSQLVNFFEATIEKYTSWLKIYDAHQLSKITSIEGLNFPFEEYREGQYKFMGAIYQTLITNDILYSTAPTGVGKTVASLFSALKTIKDPREKIFYLTAKNAGKAIVVDTINLLKKSGLKSKTTIINSKETMCLMDKVDCDPEICPYSKGYFNREREAVNDIFVHTDLFTKDIITDYAKYHNICPHEFSLTLSNFSDIVVCDYNYAFDPRVHLIRYFDDDYFKPKLLVDEAHNLIDRTRSMYSAKLNLSTLYDLKKATAKVKPSPKVQITKLIEYIKEYAEQIELDKSTFYYQNAADYELLSLVEKITLKIDRVLAENKKIPNRDKILDGYFELIQFNKISEYYNDKYRYIVEKNYDDISITLSCLDASEFILDIIKRRVKGIAFFSATLSPIDYYVKLITAGEGKSIKIPSPFKQDHLGIYVVDNVSTRYKDRTRSIPDVIDTIYNLISSKIGNYIVFFPSYQYLNMVLDEFSDDGYEVFVQQRKMRFSERNETLNSFTKVGKKTKIGFFVLGGSFSEGIDYIGDMLSGVLIVGVALPQFNKYNQLLKSHFDDLFDEGFDYAYTYPGMNKVIQAVGRVIRTKNDRGVAILIDDRYTNYKYLGLYPKNWSHYLRISNQDKLEFEIDKFFNKAAKK
ncbi:MAG: helicase C-terminal domain-containing protein [Candidatus Izemoplasma sp.]